jgi:hypothetical protein
MTWPKGYKPLSLEDKASHEMEEIVCEKCSNINPSNSKFCNRCGVMLLSCINCGNTDNLSDASFCNQCGSKLSSEIKKNLQLKPQNIELDGSKTYNPSVNKNSNRPINTVISDNGIVIHLYDNHRGKSASSYPKESIDLGSALSILDNSGKLIFAYEFGSNVQGCAISPDGKLVVISTLYPDNSVYCFDILKGSLIWIYKNHIKRLPIIELRFNGSRIEVIMGNSQVMANKEYELNLDGTLTNEYQQGLDSLNKIKKGHTQEKVEHFLNMVVSSDHRSVNEGLSELAKFVKTRGAIPYYELIIHTLSNLLKKEFNLFDNTWKVIRQILKEKPDAVSVMVPLIISQFKIHPQNDADRFLRVLRELGGINPMWIIDEMEFIKQKLVSPSWQERRAAIWVVGSIGSVSPEIVKNEIIFLIAYASDPERMRKEIVESAHNFAFSELADLDVSSFNVATTDSLDAVWLRDACIDAIGTIGEKYSEYVKAAIPLLLKLSEDLSFPYTAKKSIRALDAITSVPPP